MNMTEERKCYDLKFRLKIKLSVKAWFVNGEINRLKSAINLPLKAKKEGCLVEGGNHFLETKFFLIIPSPTYIYASEK